MKVLILLLNFYILTLSVLSCKDKEEDSFVQDQPVITLVASAHPEKDIHSEDACPPFCTCTCCGVYKTIPEHVLLTKQLQTSISTVFSPYTIAFPKAVSRSIWQPPQLG